MIVFPRQGGWRESVSECFSEQDFRPGITSIFFRLSGSGDQDGPFGSQCFFPSENREVGASRIAFAERLYQGRGLAAFSFQNIGLDQAGQGFFVIGVKEQELTVGVRGQVFPAVFDPVAGFLLELDPGVRRIRPDNARPGNRQENPGKNGVGRAGIYDARPYDS